MAKKTDSSTSTGLPSVVEKEVTKAEADAFDLDPHLINLMWEEPFFAAMLRRVTKLRTEAIPTAGVLAADGDIKMWWNPWFLASLTSAQVKGLCKHEVYHLSLGHTTTRRMEPHLVHNYATDLAINCMIPEDELPPGGLVPGKAFDPLTDEVIAKIGAKAVERYGRISEKIASLPPDLSSEKYFALLQDVAEDIEHASKGKTLAQALKDGDVQIDENGDLVDSDGNPVRVVPGGMDDHDGWDELNDAERELIKGKIEHALAEAVDECDSSGRWGSVSAEHRNKLRDILRKEIDWRSILKQFCGLTRRADRTSAPKRLNRKYPTIHPGSKRNYTSSIAIYLDQSGSVNNDALNLLFGNLMNLARHTEFTLYNFDTEVDEKSERTWRRGKTAGIERTRCGGTDFSAPTQHANANRHRFDGYLILTDGEAADPGPTNIRRGWVIIPGRKLVFEPSRRDFVIMMKAAPSA